MSAARRFICFLGVALSGLGTGCADPGRLFKLHTAPDRRADAERTWRGVRARVKIQLAQELLDSGNTRDARAALQEVAGAASDDPAVLVLLAKIELADGKLPAARQAAQTALAMPDPQAETFYVAGLIEERYGNLSEAARCYEGAQALAPGDVDYLLARAEALVKLDRPVEAIHAVETRLPDFPEDVSPQLFVAETNQMLGLKDAAVAAYREAVRISDGDPRIGEAYGLALEAAGNDEQAIRVLSPLVARASRGDAAGGNGHRGPRGAKPKVATTEPSSHTVSPAVRRALARCYLRSGMAPQARTLLVDLLSENGRDAEGWALMTRVGFAVGDAALAREAAERLASLDGGAPGRLLGAYAAMRDGDASGAMRGVSEVLSSNPRDVMALCMLACLQANAGEHAAAIRTLDHILRIDPDCSAAVQLRRQLKGDAPAARPISPAAEAELGGRAHP